MKRSEVDLQIDASATEALRMLEAALRTGSYVPSMGVRRAIAAVNGASARVLQAAPPLDADEAG